ncbi:hypothetical protein [Pedobacter xixiisoli]|nr:hypothetical protein [Pedobacter xixiisoli]
MENLNKNFIVEIKNEILHHAFSHDTNYAYQEVGQILRKVQAIALKHFSLDADKYATSWLTLNLRHSELELSKIYWQDGNKRDRSERLKWFVNGYIEALDGIILNLPISSKVYIQ